MIRHLSLAGLCWIQNFAAQYGCILESTGEFAKLKREEQV